MTNLQAQLCYIAAGGPTNHDADEWEEIIPEMEAIIAASSNRKAADVIRWWDCWKDDPRRYNPTRFARRARDFYGLIKEWDA